MSDSRYSSPSVQRRAVPPPPLSLQHHKRTYSSSRTTQMWAGNSYSSTTAAAASNPSMTATTTTTSSCCTPPRMTAGRSRSAWSTGHHKKPRMTPSPIVLRYPPNSAASSSRTRASSITPTTLYRSNSGGTSNTTAVAGNGGGGEADRFIPSRRGMSLELSRNALLSGSSRSLSCSIAGSVGTPDSNGHDSPNTTDEKATQSPAETPIQKEYKRRMMSSICNVPLDMLDEDAQPRRVLHYGSATSADSTPMSANVTAASAVGASTTVSDENNNTIQGGSPWRVGRTRLENPFQHDTLRVLQQFESISETFSSSVRGSETMIHRKIPSQPCRILDAPDLVDDFYLNLISWSPDNILAVALAHCVYLWNASTGEIQHLATIEGDDDYVTSVSWCTVPGQSKYLAIGTNSHAIQLWDTEASQVVRTLRGHAGRVASMAWNQHWLTSGGRDSLILQHDVRAANHLVSRYKAHEQEVCGLKWNDDGTSLASGGNENYLCIWDAAMSMSNSRNRNRRSSNHHATDVSPRLILKKHKAAVKALDWCPFNRGLLATGGGTADRTIKLWNSNSGAMLRSIDTGSQVCSVVWSKHQRELCSSHGFSENQLILWKYGSRSSLTKVKELTGHTARILSLACSPDGSTVVSAAGDESLRFWNVFGSAPSRRSSILPMGELTFGMPTIR
jgi:cell division cycle 20, cofactor of APC complex